MRVLEMSKWSAQLNILKLPTLDIAAVLRRPFLTERADRDPDLNPVAVADTAGLRDYFQWLPRWRQAGERTRPRMPVEHSFGRCWQYDATLERFHGQVQSKKSNPLRTEALVGACQARRQTLSVTI